MRPLPAFLRAPQKPAFRLLVALLAISLISSGCDPSKGRDASRILAELQLGGEPENAMIRLEKVLAAEPDNCALIEARALLSLRLPEDAELLIAKQAAVAAIQQCRTIGFLDTAFRDNDPAVRAKALHVASDLGTSGLLPRMRYLLEDRDKDVRKAALYAVGKLRDHKARMLCLLLLNDADWSVRAEAARVAVLIGKPNDAKRLFTLLADGDDYVRYEAQEALISFFQADNKELYEAAIRGDHGDQARVLSALAVFVKAGTEREDLWKLLVKDLMRPEPQHPVRTAAALLNRDRERAVPLVRTAARQASSDQIAAKLNELASE